MTRADQLGRSAVPYLVMERYRPEEPLGVGGSAEVWRGIDERLGRPVAIKLLHSHLLRDAAARERFEREARAAAALSHPGIVGVYDVDASPAGAAIVLELVQGETLSDRLAREGVLPPAEVARIGAELAEALAHAHERGVVHRDVKPGNVLLDRDGRARLVDFGIARVLDSEAAPLTTEGMIAGTLRYLAPEQLAGDESTPASDLYALGAVLYEMASGRPAFIAPTAVALAQAQQRLPEDPAGVPPELTAVWRAALDPDPSRRPASAADMATALRSIAGTPLRDTVDANGIALVQGPTSSTTGNGQRPAAVEPDSRAPGFAGSDTATLVVPKPELATGTPGLSARVGGSVARRGTWAGVGAMARGFVAARSAWLSGLLAALLLTAVVVLAVTALGSGSALLAPAGGAERSPAASVSANPTAMPTATPALQPTEGPGGGKGKGKGKGGG